LIGSSHQIIPLALHFLAGLYSGISSPVAQDRLRPRREWLSRCLVMDGHYLPQSARTNEDQKGGPRRDYSIIRGTLLWTHCTLTYLPSGIGCLALPPYRIGGT
jgi:hypothetical protein